MDNLTHALSGVLLSRAGVNRLAPQAGWLMVVAANLPDIEILTGLHDPLLYLDLHRGPTHAFAWAPLLALAPLPLWRWLARRARPGLRQWAGAYLCSLIAVLSHLLIDWTNAYGVRLAMPWSERWHRLDWVHVVDVWVWLLLGGGVAAMALGRLVSREIGARAGRGRVGAWVVLALFLAYTGFRAEMHAQAVAVMEARLYQGETARYTAAIPGAFNPFRWRGLVETGGAWRVVDVDLRREFNPEAARVFYKPADSAALAAARASRTGRTFTRFAQAPVWQQAPAAEPEGAVEVMVSDLRFGDPEDGRFAASWLVSAAGEILDERFDFGTYSSAPRPQAQSPVMGR